MSDLIHMPWLARRLTVTGSTDPTLIGVSGVVQTKTRLRCQRWPSSGKSIPTTSCEQAL